MDGRYREKSYPDIRQDASAERKKTTTDHRRITRKDIAQKAGVSVSVVSRALNNNGYVQKEVKERIIQIAQELHYAPYGSAMTLRQEKTKQLLFVCKDLHNSFNIDLYYGMMKESMKQGYLLLVSGELNFSLLKEASIDGIIFGNEYTAYKYDRMYKKSFHLPAVSACFGQYFHMHKAMHFVVWDLYAGMEQAIQYLRKRRHKKIAFASYDSLLSNDTRMLAWIHSMSPVFGKDVARYHLGRTEKEQEAAVDLKESDMVDRNLGIHEEEDFFHNGLLAAADYVEKKLDASAVICFNDELAFGFIQGLQRAGLHIPDDVSVLSFDGSSRLNQSVPSLTTYTCYPEKMGQKLVELLIRVLNGEFCHFVNRIPGTVLEGDSVRDFK